MLKPIAALLMFVALAGNAPETDLELTFELVRNERGMLRLCVTQDTRHFPDCSGDSAAIRRSVPATVKSVHFEGLSPGSYAISIVHDENANGRMDSFLGIRDSDFPATPHLGSDRRAFSRRQSS